MTFGSISTIIPAQNVKVERDGEELVITTDVKFRGNHVRTTTTTRAGPVYTFQWRDREIEITVAMTEDLLTQVETDNELNSRSALTFTNWRIHGLNQSNNTSDDTDDTYSAAVVDYEEMAPENGVAQLRIKLLIAGEQT